MIPHDPSQDPHPRTPFQHELDISIIGETNLDLIMYGLPEELPLEREVLASDFLVTLGGSSSILAHNLSILGSRVGFSSLVGGDAMGAIALQYLQEAGVGLSHVIRDAGKKTGVTVLLPHGAQRRILTYPGTIAELSASRLDFSFLVSAPHVHLSSLFLQTGLHEGLPALLDRLKAAGKTLSLDTNDDPADEWAGILPEVLDRVDLLLPNEDEVLRITKTDSVEVALDRLQDRVPTVVVKCGKRGALVQAEGRRHWIAPHPVEAVDTIGAGDSFDAGFLHARLHGASVKEAAELGNLTGALSVLQSGGVEAFRDTQLRNRFLASSSWVSPR